MLTNIYLYLTGPEGLALGICRICSGRCAGPDLFQLLTKFLIKQIYFDGFLIMRLSCRDFVIAMGGGCFSLMRCFDGTGWAKSYLYSIFNIIYIMSKLKGSLGKVYPHNRLIKIGKRA